MVKRYRTVGLVLVALGFLTAGVSAQNNSVQGSVKGSDGKPLSGGNVGVERVDTKAAPVNAKMDRKGHYEFAKLPPGTYKITVYENNVPKSTGNITTRTEGYLRVDFDLAAKSSSIHVKHYIWVKSETGTNFSGKWVEADDNAPGVNPVDKMGNKGAQKMMMDSHGSGKPGS
ncbi:MAG: Carboxypeptidase regulatory-like domain [Verrucomicrobiota bacterium]|jgi:hypothetical protein